MLAGKIFVMLMIKGPEAVVRRYSVKKVFLEISQNSEENSCAKVGLQLY